jgi:pyruvate dehydrogenase E2 component (dihydrolipoamide acetyltransferase)
MAKEIFIPKLGQTVEEVTIMEWLVPDGVMVDEGQEIIEVETDKTNFRVEAAAGGYLHRGPFAAGQVVPVLTVVGVIGGEGEMFGETRKQGDKETGEAPAASPDHPVTLRQAQGRLLSPDYLVTVSPFDKLRAGSGHRVMASPRARRLAEERGVDLAAIVPTGGGGVRVTERDVVDYLRNVPVTGAPAPKATPLAEKLATEAGIDLRVIVGTGPGGKVTKEDVEQAIKATVLAVAPIPAAPPPAVVPVVPAPRPIALPEVEVTECVPLKGVRGIIAERMGTSVHTTARVTLMMEVDATEFVALRERLKAKVEKEWGFAPGYNDLLAKIVATALRKFPYVNARLTPDAIERLAHINLGMAVDTERGLLVPVIRDADKKSLREFGAEFRALVERARQGKSLPDDLTGGTFTITNLGMYDVDAFTPVINLPEAAILGVGRIAPQWAYRPELPDKPVLRQMLTLSLVFDHRVVDGAPAARFLQYIKELIEEPYLLLAA